MAIRIRTVNGVTVALCAYETDPLPGDTYLDDGQHYALAAKFRRDWHGQKNDFPYPVEWAAMDTQKLRDAETGEDLSMDDKNEFEMALDAYQIAVGDRQIALAYVMHYETIRKALEFMARNGENDLKDALRDVLKAVAFDNPHAVHDTIWVGPSPIGDFIMGALDEEIDLDEDGSFQAAPYRCKQTAELPLEINTQDLSNQIFSEYGAEDTYEDFTRGFLHGIEYAVEYFSKKGFRLCLVDAQDHIA